jgi:HSP20 family protein
MLNLIRRPDPTYPLFEWEPLKMMRDYFNWDPFAEIVPTTHPRELRAFVPTFEVKETHDAYLFFADLPGVKEEDLEITVTGTRLTIAGKREGEVHSENDRFYNYERSYGTFTRAFTLPEGINTEEVFAELKNGVLFVKIAKVPEAKARKISLKTFGEKIKGALGGEKVKA